MNDLIRAAANDFTTLRAIVLPLLITLATAGCGRADRTKLAVFPVSGRVLIDGEPPVRAEIRLKPKAPLADPLKRSVEPYAFVQDDGSFEIGTYSNDDGAPPGEYALTMVWPVVTVEGGEDVFGKDRLNGRFSDPKSPIATVEVQKPGNEIPLIELKSK